MKNTNCKRHYFMSLKIFAHLINNRTFSCLLYSSVERALYNLYKTLIASQAWWYMPAVHYLESEGRRIRNPSIIYIMISR